MVASTSLSLSDMATPNHAAKVVDWIDYAQSLNLLEGKHTFNTPPCPGQTYAIRDRKSGCLVTLIDGKIRLVRCTKEQGGWHWTCAEENGWLTFRSPVSGRYIGFGKSRFLCIRRHPQGGYVLLARQNEELLKMTTRKNKDILMFKTSDEALWDFEVV
ncbi:hypothetical protein GGR53DRAFT_192018 [Hypoxylon sp. FL1150]|nr:hypothetical protein GGR53DRAFT_192018 [Hypoxylon sp. FL1150]